MASYDILKNQPLVVNLPTDYAVQGWIVSENKGYHSGCNSGYMDRVFNLSSATQWTFKYKIIEFTSGSVNIVVNGVNGISHSEIGEFTETFNVTGPNVLVRFFSTGVNAIEVLQVYPTLDFSEGTTLAFSEDADKWVTYYSYIPEQMNKFVNDFFVFKNGRLWEQNTNEVRNNFFGVQYTSKIIFYVNLSPSEVNNYFSMRQKSNKVWTSANDGDIYIYPSEGKPDGQRSRLKRGRFKRLQTDWFVDFLRDLSDPRFTTEDEALFKGALLQGNVMKITIENDDTTEVRMFSIDVTVSKQDLTY